MFCFAEKNLEKASAPGPRGNDSIFQGEFKSDLEIEL